jgi:hypothetical protein
MVLRAELLSNWDWENATAAAEVASSREEWRTGGELAVKLIRTAAILDLERVS